MSIRSIIQVTLVLIALNCYGQAAFTKGSGNVTLGYGFPYVFEELFVDKRGTVGVSFWGYGSNDSFDYDSKGFGPIIAKCEFGIKKHHGIVLIIGYSGLNIKETRTYENKNQNNVSEQFTDITEAKIRTMSIGFRYNIHFFKMKVLDPYVGFGGGYMRILKEISFQSDNPDAVPKWEAIDPVYFPAFVSVTVGLKYYFKPMLGVYGEFGFDNWTTAQLGIVLKLD